MASERTATVMQEESQQAGATQPRHHPLRRLSVLLLTDCAGQLRTRVLQSVAGQYGFELEVVAALAGDARLIEERAADLTVLEPVSPTMHSRIWDRVLLGPERYAAELASIKAQLSSTLQQALAHLKRGLLLVKGVSMPPTPPLGRAEFRSSLSFDWILAELNGLMRELLRDAPNAMFVDEERVWSYIGKAHVFGPMAAPYGCYMLKNGDKLLLGGMTATAREYFECYLAWSGHTRIKCVVVDLDNTLWPGVVGEGGLLLNSDDEMAGFALGPFGGLHQALHVLKQRGIVLATCSKNNPDEVFRLWSELVSRLGPFGEGIILSPDDFVLHKIGWNRKSESMREISEELGVQPSALAFIDDNPIERAEVHAAMPEVRSLGEDLQRVRHTLLTDPAFQVSMVTAEAQQRSTMMRAQLSREAARKASSDEGEFLRTLGIEIEAVDDRAGEQLPRIVELIQRTTQFNTTQPQYDAEAIRQLMAQPDCGVYTLKVKDRFTHYGLVGVCIMRGARVDAFLMSCRVLALKVAVPFLLTVLRMAGLHGQEIRGKIIPTERNVPCRNLFLDAGFTAEGSSGEFVSRAQDTLPEVDASTYAVVVRRAG